jgi:O-antigen/teichoic acid export membrane protein
MSDSSDDIKANQVHRGIAWNSFAQAVISIADMVSIAVTLALFASEVDFGIAGLALWLFPILDTVTDLGVASAIIQKNDHSKTKISTVFWINFMIALALCGLVLALSPMYARWQGQAIVFPLLAAYCSKLLMQNAYTIPLALMRKAMRFDEVAKIRMTAHLAESLARPLIAAAGAPIWCFVLAPLVRTVVVSVAVQVRQPFRPSWTFRYDEIRDYLAFGLRSGATQVLYQIYVNLDYPIVGFAFGPASLGAYQLAYQLILEPVRSITNVVSDVALPAFSALKDNTAARVRQFQSFTRLNLIAVLPFLVLLFLVIPDAIALFAKAQSAESRQLTVTCVRVLCSVGVLRALGFIGPPLLDGMGRPDLSLRYMMFAAVALPLCFINGAYYGGERWNAVSVAIAWAVGYPVAFILLLRMVLRQLPLSAKDYVRPMAAPVVCALVGLAVGSGMSELLSSSSRGIRLAAVTSSAVVTMLAGFRWIVGLRWKEIRRSIAKT